MNFSSRNSHYTIVQLECNLRVSGSSSYLLEDSIHLFRFDNMIQRVDIEYAFVCEARDRSYHSITW